MSSRTFRWKYGLEQFDNVKETNNNGLGYTVELLEEIYTNPKFPKGMAPSLEISLKESGKSRADLWAFAAITAVEYGIETNNAVCDDTFDNNMDAPKAQCNQEKGQPHCKVNVPEGGLKFQTGRTDCTEFGDKPYKATKIESHPNPVGSGNMTAEFFNKDFGFTTRETAAILGAHTMGRFHSEISLFRYVWTTSATESFNNHYYKNIVLEDRYAFDDESCTLLGDAEGRKPKTRWLARVREKTKNGGPVAWIHENYRGPNCVTKSLAEKDGQFDYENCCNGQSMVADSDLMEDDPSTNEGCERFGFNFGLDEQAMSAELGLYFDFEVDEEGVPFGCSGLEYFKRENWFNEKSNVFTTSVKPKDWVTNPDTAKPYHFEYVGVECPKNNLAIPEGSTPVHQVFEEYAKDQDKWVQDFLPTYQKMLANGYADGELQDSPYEFDRYVCTRGPKEGSFHQHCELI